MSMFSKGDKVRCIQTWTTHVIDRGGEYTVDDVRPDNVADVMEALVRGDWVPFSYFEKVEPEWVVGQQVSGDDYKRLPVGSVVNEIWKKVAPNDWRNANFADQRLMDEGLYNDRTLTHLPDATRPEDATDAYVEPEPLKEGDAVLVWAKVVDPERDDLGDFAIDVMYGATFDRTFARIDAIVRPDAGQVPPWVKPAEDPEPSASEVIMAVLTQSSAEMARRMQVFADAAEEFGRRLREQIEGHSDSEGGAS